ncbi:MAG: YlxR family protein [Actinomycetota bacterium]|nr:YlxR family protein [Actinomycetota bacterium]
MRKARKTPQRSCVGCATGSDKRELVRIVRTSDGHVSVDPSGKANGRGAYLCPETECLDAAIRRKRLDASLRVSLKEDDIHRLRREFDEALHALPASQQGR